ncbi:MAG: phosphatidylglycerophosphatase A [Candidatus Omnitrophota bacterium]|nr:MAG: phosphatidylglycerophosphatase A [Candidatus Omnitrophota bacterium]
MGKQKTYKNFLKVTVILLSTLFGIGYLPILGGTFASLAGVFTFILFFKSNLSFFLFTLITIFISFPLSSWGERIFEKKDAKEIVIDDFSGMLISLLFLPKKGPFIFLAFLLFRLFDFLKIYPANKLEKLKGGFGIVGDDLCAGIYTNIFLHVFKFILKISS